MKFDITVLLDRSGSMQERKDDHIGGLKSFIEDNKEFPDTLFNLIQFDSQNSFELLINNKNINDIDTDKIELIPRGGTPLIDAVGKTIAFIDDKKLDNADVQTVLMIITDGQENCSTEWTKENLKKIIQEKEKTWKILYLGANVDAFAEAGAFGLSARSTANYTNNKSGVDAVYRVTNEKMRHMRSAYDAGETQTSVLCSEGANFTDLDYQALSNTTEE